MQFTRTPQFKRTESLSRLFLYLIPTFIFFLAVFFIREVNLYKLRLSIIETAFFSGIIYLFHTLLPKGKLKSLIFYLGYLIIVIAVFIQASYYNLFADRISASTIFIIIETNAAETSEFLSAYFNSFSLILLVSLLAPLVLLKFPIKTFKIYLPGNALGAISLFILLFVYQYKSLANHNLYHIAYNSYHGYMDETELFDKYELDKPIGGIKDVKVTPSEKRKIFVIVIGESTTRHRMSLYGYERQTNPQLENIQEDLLIYKNVISPHTHSIPSLTKAITFNHYEDENRLKEGSIVQLMNSAGFETHWISNQKPFGLHETFISKMAQASQYIQFLNIKNTFPPKDYDDIIFDPLEKTLLREKNLFVVIHLMGTHGEYYYRYPSSYEYFTGKSSTLNNVLGLKKFNDYDNAIRYNDFIISEIISRVKKHKADSYVLYFSDHGEDVYQVNNSAGHTETNGSYPMYDVPFILWRSESFKENFPINFEPNRSYMLDDLIFSISDLSGIDFEEFKQERSIFNENFRERDRIIYDGKNYDSIFRR